MWPMRPMAGSSRGVLWHRGKGSFRWLLDENDAARFLDGTYAESPVRARAGQHNGDPVAPRGSDGAKDHVDRRPLAARLRKRPRGDGIAVDHQLAIRRNDVNAIGLEGRTVGDLQHRHASAGSQDLVQGARMVGREVQDDDISETKISRKEAKERLQRSNATRRSTDRADRRELGPLERPLFGSESSHDLPIARLLVKP